MELEYHINNLPTEILYEVFDFLKFEQQKVATAVCKRWHTVLSSEKYISRRSLCLNTWNLNGDSSQLQRMKRYRAFTIKDSNIDSKCLEPLRNFFFCQEVSEKVEQLRMELVWYSLSDLLGDNNVLHLPKLKKIRYFSPIRVEQQSSMRYKLVIPNLKTVILENAHESVNSLLQTVNDQIETLSVKFIDIKLFCAALGNLPFSNLTSLTLTPHPKCSCFLESDFHELHLQMFGRLKYLEISDRRNVFYSIYRLIFREAKNLETLVINGRKMSEDAFNQLDRLKKLKKLYLMIKIENSQCPVRLSLPLLEEMTTYASAIVPLRNAPNLRSIFVMNYKHPWNHYRFAENAINCGILTPYLLALKLHEVCLDSLFVNHICTITGLRTLELNRVRMESKHLERIFSALKHLQRVQLERCYINDVTETSRESSTTMDVEDDGNDNDQDEDESDKPDCVQMLQEQFPGLRITNWQNQLVRNLEQMQTMYHRVMPYYWMRH